MKKTAWMGIAGLALALGLSACKSNGTGATAPSVSAPANASGVSTPVTATWRPADKTAEFLSAFRPQE
jgi:hypothetical protein